MVKRTFLFDGVVQNVHFRKSVESFAYDFNCAVLAVNATDRTVVVSLQGDYNDIDEIIHMVSYSFRRSNALVVAYRELN